MSAPRLDPSKRAQIVACVRKHGGNLTHAAIELAVDKACVARELRERFGPDLAEARRRVLAGEEGAEPTAAPRAEAVARVMAAMSPDPGRETVVTVEPGPAVALAVPGKHRVVEPQKKYERVAFVSDMHHPFLDQAAFKAAMGVLRDYRPGLVILGGDQFDCFSISDHDREPGRADYLQDEFDAAQPTWREIDSLGCDVAFLAGNHEERIERIQRRTPGLFKLRALELPRAAELPKRWMWCPNQTRIRMGSLTAIHGDLKGRGTNSMHAAAGMLRKLRTTCVFGHLHRFQSFFETCDDGTIRGGYANGHLSEVTEAKYIQSPDWQEGITTIDFDWSLGIFSVTPHMIVKKAILWNGRTYAA
jgi:hypothetical protein